MQFLNAVVDELCGASVSFDLFAHKLQCDPKDLRRLKSSWKLFITLAFGRSLSVEDMTADLVTAGLAADFVGGVLTVLGARRDEIRARLASQPTCTPYLKDFDWKLNLSVSSDKAASLNAPVVLLSLNVGQPQSDVEAAEKPGEVGERHVVELTQAELVKLVAQLEAMNVAMAGLE